MRARPKRRYPLEPLARAAGRTVSAILKEHGVGGSCYQDWIERGVAEPTADALAVRYGHHPFDIWPEMLDHNLADAEAPEADYWALPDKARRRKFERDRKASARAQARAQAEPKAAPARSGPSERQERVRSGNAALSDAERDEIVALVLGVLSHLAGQMRAA